MFFSSLFTYSTVQNIIWKADCHASYEKKNPFFMEPDGSSPCSQKPATGPYPEPVQVRGALKKFVTNYLFYG
jgi:hypothetical protein